MDRKTYDALVESVAKWRKNVNVHHPFNMEIGLDSCSLCFLFIANDCQGCPVNEVSGSGCRKTPYGEAFDAYERWDATACFKWKADKFSQRKAEWRVAAKREAEFLAALVPAGGPTE